MSKSAAIGSIHGTFTSVSTSADVAVCLDWSGHSVNCSSHTPSGSVSLASGAAGATPTFTPSCCPDTVLPSPSVLGLQWLLMEHTNSSLNPAALGGIRYQLRPCTTVSSVLGSTVAWWEAATSSVALKVAACATLMARSVELETTAHGSATWFGTSHTSCTTSSHSNAR